MDLDEMERIAMRGEPMPEGLTQAKQVYFQGLSLLYARFRDGRISREQGSADKGKMLHECRVREGTERAGSRLAEWHAKLRKDIEWAQIAYQKDRTLENADRLSAALDGRLS